VAISVAPFCELAINGDHRWEFAMNQMFCFQCEQTAAGRGCVGVQGVCGKTADVAVKQDGLTGALIGLARAVAEAGGEQCPPDTAALMVECLVATATNVNFDGEDIDRLTDKVRREREQLGQRGRDLLVATDEYDLGRLWGADEDVRSLKSLVLLGARGLSAYAHHAAMLGKTSDEINNFLPVALRAVGNESLGQADLLPLVLETGRINMVAMKLLDGAHTEAYGLPAPKVVPLSIEKGPFVIISGHDLHDLKLLLEQTDGRGVNVYTHGEMLPAHAYPELSRHPQLKGNFGTAWTNQQREFDGVPGAILFTTNCIMPVRESYSDRVFTTAMVGYPGLKHIGPEKDFGAVIAKAIELGGYSEKRQMVGANGGSEVVTGFGHGTILSVADKVVDAVKSGALKHIFLVGGCDGAKPGRDYYTEFVKEAPSDTLILTLACGKYRFNDMNLGEIGGLPRLMDVGQCNDAFSAIKVAVTLAGVFECGVNDLPLTLVLSWYEQKAVSILLTLLHLGIKNILIGPSLPSFVSPAVLNILVESYQLTPIGTAKRDLLRILGQ